MLSLVRQCRDLELDAYCAPWLEATEAYTKDRPDVLVSLRLCHEAGRRVLHFLEPIYRWVVSSHYQPLWATSPNLAIRSESSNQAWLKRGNCSWGGQHHHGSLQDGREPIIKALTQLFNRCLSDGRVPSSWKNASVVLIHKKGDTADIKNYRPISLLPVIYKVFSHILFQRMLQALEQHQPQEQAAWLQARILHHWPHSCC